eukprot:jgi/Chlat1/2171/Chrsp17S02740
MAVGGGGGGGEEELPRSIVRRIVRSRLAAGSGLQKDALTALSHSALVFVHLLTATANDICQESKRQTLNADDVLKAVAELDFPELIPPLKASLEEFRRHAANKKAEAGKKRKAGAGPAEEAEADADAEVEGGDREEEHADGGGDEPVERRDDEDEEAIEEAKVDVEVDADENGEEGEGNDGGDRVGSEQQESE